MTKLEEIITNKLEEVRRATARTSFDEIQELAEQAPPVRPFRMALEDSGKPLALIGEVKKASPSKGLIRANFDAAEVARAYRDAGTDCLSVLTDEIYFQGSRQNLEIAREISGLPCLRKDFIVDPYQVYESRAWGADCILLIVAALTQSDLCNLCALAKQLGMDVLVEVHSRIELAIASEVGGDLIGVNNRNLADMSTTISTSEALLPLIPASAMPVSESALETRADLDRVQAAGARAVLIGSTFCAAPDIGAKVREVMGW